MNITILDIIGIIIFTIGLAVCLGMFLSLFMVTMETAYEFYDKQLTKFKKRFKK